MRVCLVSREVSPFFGAGIGTYAASMLRAWRDAGHETHLVCPAHPGVEAWGAALGIGVRTVPVDPLASPSPPAALPSSRHRFMFLAHSAAALEHVEQIAPDYAEFPDYWAEGFAAVSARRAEGALAGTVIGVRLHTPTSICREVNRDAWLDDEIATLELAEDEAIRGADLVLSPTRALLDRVRTSIGPMPTAAVVPYPFLAREWAATEPAPDTSEAHARWARPIILYYGRLEPRKGVALLVQAGQRALEAGLDATFRFIGADTRIGGGGAASGSMLERLRAAIAPRWADRFEFHPPRPRDALRSEIRAAASSGGLCCFPSVWENFPNTCLEAMALGAPVLGSDAGGMAEIITPGESGLLFRSGDASDLAQSLTSALADRARLAALGASGAARIAALCDPPTVVAATVAAIERARQASSAAPASMPPTTPSIQVLRADQLPGDGTASDRLLVVVRDCRAEWIVLAGSDPEPEAIDSLARAAARNPAAAAILPWTEDQGVVRTPVGLDRDLLAVFPCHLGSAWALRREAALALIEPGLDAGVEWDMLVTLAIRGEPVVVLPRVLARGAPSRAAPADIDAFAAALARRHTDLIRRADRVVRLMAWQRWRLRQRAAELAGMLRAAAAERDAAREELRQRAIEASP
ncbi:MAG: glycosyltransferase family 4 protein [Phycisphaerae bacterium]|nr:glycosyltransferase family 4 protein [Phycisphaerae bacterium]